jgi:hypothetical protein
VTYALRIAFTATEVCANHASAPSMALDISGVTRGPLSLTTACRMASDWRRARTLSVKSGFFKPSSRKATSSSTSPAAIISSSGVGGGRLPSSPMRKIPNTDAPSKVELTQPFAVNATHKSTRPDTQRRRPTEAVAA